ncbi:odorant receptor Or2 isoform X1 [Lasioglossum baleicum]|uniref:odorant receptor Or2 isoform X1 n=1 Tax=Lasioglossum baleicum TaxID=434251 RepID=UPI003FCCC862
MMYVKQMLTIIVRHVIFVQLSNAVLVTQATRDLTEAVYFLIFQFSYLFLCNYASQLLINHSSNVFGIIYDTEWYSIPVPVQKLIILIMKRSIQPCILTLGKIYPPSCEGFAMICNMSMSYFMFLCSIQRSEM